MNLHAGRTGPKTPAPQQTDAAGYRSRAFARSLVHVGPPRELPRSGGWLLEREISGTNGHDLCGTYPLLSFERPAELIADLDELDTALSSQPAGDKPSPVSVTAVIDPLSGASLAQLVAAFPDRLDLFKQHCVVDLAQPAHVSATQHHRRNLRRGLSDTRVEAVDWTPETCSEWVQLYAGLRERHGFRGAADFPRAAFEALADVSGLVAYRAHTAGRTLGMQLWMHDGERAWYHLGATTEEGYTARAAYALMGTALDDLGQRGACVALLGAGAGPSQDESDGLLRFKRGWATHTLPAYLGGRILDRAAYAALSESLGGSSTTDWFPTYRRP